MAENGVVKHQGKLKATEWALFCWEATEVNAFYHCYLCAHSVAASVPLLLKSDKKSYSPA